MSRVRHHRRWVALAGLLSGLAVLTSGCAGTGDSYVSSTSTKTFFKVPGAWRVFHRDQIASSQAGNASLASTRFLVVLDGDPKPSLDHDLATARFPFGVARVRSLAGSERDAYSLAALRNEVIRVDDMLQADPNSVEVISAPRSITRGGLRGSRLAYTVHAPGGASFSVEQIGLVDSATHTVWFLLVGCEATCFQRTRSTISRVLDSWTVKAK